MWLAPQTEPFHYLQASNPQVGKETVTPHLCESHHVSLSGKFAFSNLFDCRLHNEDYDTEMGQITEPSQISHINCHSVTFF